MLAIFYWHGEGLQLFQYVTAAHGPLSGGVVRLFVTEQVQRRVESSSTPEKSQISEIPWVWAHSTLLVLLSDSTAHLPYREGL